ncbi:hypothetical protein [Rhodococcus phage REQ1]|uniref:hypothetical protein n=1 Tax=Rhodococcus phage REQ1 TaxID=1109712 RepID=UPI00023EEC68|nr:hypothetical protein RoPhREQ1_gp70 [Rhodococcus phage REQ1]AEV52066.1 hypothetical protein [Rhodococcus phage REQ1]
MALGDPYITKDELRDYLQIQSDVIEFDQKLTDACASASREVEQHCGRQFNKSDTATPRIFQIERRRKVTVDDFHTSAGLVIEQGDGLGNWEPVDTASCLLAPYDAIVDGLPWPYYRLEFPGCGLVPSDRYQARFLRVTAQWGWPSVPATVKQAAFQIAAQTYRLADAPLGVTGNTQYGGVVRVQDLPVVATKLCRFVVNPILVG